MNKPFSIIDNLVKSKKSYVLTMMLTLIGLIASILALIIPIYINNSSIRYNGDSSSDISFLIHRLNITSNQMSKDIDQLKGALESKTKQLRSLILSIEESNTKKEEIGSDIEILDKERNSKINQLLSIIDKNLTSKDWTTLIISNSISVIFTFVATLFGYYLTIRRQKKNIEQTNNSTEVDAKQ